MNRWWHVCLSGLKAERQQAKNAHIHRTLNATCRLYDPGDRSTVSDHFHQSFFTNIRQTTFFAKVWKNGGEAIV